jgi:hypothetical protein
MVNFFGETADAVHEDLEVRGTGGRGAHGRGHLFHFLVLEVHFLLAFFLAHYRFINKFTNPTISAISTV